MMVEYMNGPASGRKEELPDATLEKGIIKLPTFNEDGILLQVAHYEISGLKGRKVLPFITYGAYYIKEKSDAALVPDKPGDAAKPE